ncbi:MAG: DUF927 domain-containing protein [Sulfurisoma sp.]|nr:DUF927 domain-containing protein [Sulfurisoma sp.]
MALILARSGALVPCDPAPAKVGAGDTATADTGRQSSRFDLTERGVIFNDPERGARWVCAPLDVVALVRDPHNAGWGLLCEFADPDRQPHRVIVAMALFRGDGAEVAGLLLDRGLKIAPKGKPLLLEYLQSARTSKRARITNRTGWHDAGAEGAVFVLPDQAIGSGGDEWIFESESPAANTFRARGTLQRWQQEVAASCEGNSRLVFAVSVAFAAPLLYLVGAEGGGFHFRSNSSDGKTTALAGAESVRAAAIAEAGKAILELPKLWLRPHDEVVECIVKVSGRELVEEAWREGRGILFLTPHLGCFEITAQYYASFRPMTVLYRRPKQAWLAPIIEDGRGANPRLAPADMSGVKKLLKALKNGEAVGMLPDQAPG